MDKEPLIVFFSSVTNNTAKFYEKVGLPAIRLPLRKKDQPVHVDKPYILSVPTYGGGDLRPSRSIPKQVLSFLQADPRHRDLCVGVISSGNVNFGEAYLWAGKLLSSKLNVPLLYGFELAGTDEDAVKVRDGILAQWDHLIKVKFNDNTVSD